MLEIIKDIILRDDGFIEITLSNMKCFDDYVYHKIEMNEGCIPCIRDSKNKLNLYYDLDHYVSLKQYITDYEFKRNELLAFLLELWKAYISINCSIPVLFDLDYIYLHDSKQCFGFIGLPLLEEVRLDVQVQAMHLKLLELIHSDDYEVIGYLYSLLHNESINIVNLLHSFEQFKDQRLSKRKWWMKKEKISFDFNSLPKAPHYMRQSYYQKNNNDQTVVLLADNPYLERVDGGSYSLDKDCTIGRSSDNEIMINSIHVSSYHAIFHKEDASIEDLHSSNGTFINGNRIYHQSLKHLDRISFADVDFIYHEV